MGEGGGQPSFLMPFVSFYHVLRTEHGNMKTAKSSQIRAWQQTLLRGRIWGIEQMNTLNLLTASIFVILE